MQDHLWNASKLQLLRKTQITFAATTHIHLTTLLLQTKINSCTLGTFTNSIMVPCFHYMANIVQTL